ncbi:hypothetical protein THAOC_05339, partial [Thalassiosira oceanica]
VYGKANFYGLNTAVASSYVMTTGSHFAEFEITGAPFIGVARPMPTLFSDGNYFCYFNRDHFHTLLAARTDEWGDGNVHACQYFCDDGEMLWTCFGSESVGGYYWIHDWEGKEDCRTGDTIGMLLNLDEGTLTVYKNDRCLGVTKDGLSGSYCWVQARKALVKKAVNCSRHHCINETPAARRLVPTKRTPPALLADPPQPFPVSDDRGQLQR